MVSPAAAAAAPLPAVEFGAMVPERLESWQERDPLVCAGVDEVGRGCLFGPVFASAVILPAQASQTLVCAGLTDSKKLTARRRAALVPLIEVEAFAWGIGQASAAEIDRCGIRVATERAMLRALQQLLPPGDPARRCRLLPLPSRLFHAAAAPLLLHSPKAFEAVLRIGADLAGFTPSHCLLDASPQLFPVLPVL